MSDEIEQFLSDFLTEKSRPDMSMQDKLDRANDQRDRAVAIADGVMAWETMQDTRNSMKDLAALKKEIKEN